MKKMKLFGYLIPLIITVLVISCNNKSKEPEKIANLYTCPMPQDSFFSDKPGKCPKCGIDLIKNVNVVSHEVQDMSVDSSHIQMAYTCPMHPQVQSDTAGTCPICGMQLEKIKPTSESNAVPLDVLLKPANQQVVASVPMVHMSERDENIEMDSYGFITYDTRNVGAVSCNFSGRIEKLYVQYRFQQVHRGQKLMDIYSPELLTAQENLLFLLKNDLENAVLINAAKQKLLLLGMSDHQLTQVIQTGKTVFTVSVYSNYSGHIHETGNGETMVNNKPVFMKDIDLTTKELSIKEGMYVQKGQNIFSIFDPAKAWAVINIFAGQNEMVKAGDRVRITPETNPLKDFRASISYIEPVYRDGSKTLSARVYFDNSSLNIPIGSQVKATVFAGNRSANWLPEEAVLSLGLEKVVFVRTGEAFSARKIETGIINKHLIQVLSGLDKTEAVAANAQYLVDSESFIKTKN